MNPIYAGRKITDIILPGTHDSMTFDLKQELGPDANNVVSLLFDKLSVMRPYIKAMAETQGATYEHQLALGVRYFDARVALDGSGVLRFTHTLLSTAEVSDTLGDTQTFLNANTQEIVIWKLGYKYKPGNKAETIQKFMDALAASGIPNLYFDDGNKAALEAFLQETYEGILNGGSRFVLILDSLITNTYDDDTTTPSSVLSRIFKMSSESTPQPFEVQCILPLSNFIYVMGALKYLASDGLGVFVGTAVALTAILGFLWPPLAALMAVGAIIAYIYFKNSSWATSIKEIQATEGITIFHGYYIFIHQNKTEVTKPMFVIIDYVPDDFAGKCLIMTSDARAC